MEQIPARPQKVHARNAVVDVWPERWGITLAQCRELMANITQDPEWRKENTMETLVDSFIKPMTAGTGLGYALLQNQEEPKEVNVMVSHAWMENAEEFFETIARTVAEDDVMFICALSLYQNTDGAGPTIAEQLGSEAKDSPFRRVLDHIKVKREEEAWLWTRRAWVQRASTLCFMAFAVLFYFPIGAADCIPMVPNFHQCAYGVYKGDYGHSLKNMPNCYWPRFEFFVIDLDPKLWAFTPLAYIAFAAGIVLWAVQRRLKVYRGLMVAVPNRQCDLYSRLWCVYEMYVAKMLAVPVDLAKTLASAGQCKTLEASCSCQEDTVRIHGEISAWGRALKTSSSNLRMMGRRVSEGSTGAKKVDQAIREVTRRAQRLLGLTVFSWVLPFVILKVCLSINSMSIDTHHHMFSSHTRLVKCDGIVSIAGGGVIVLGICFFIAKYQQGAPSTLSIITAALTLTFVGSVLQTTQVLVGEVLGKDVSDAPFPFHHCFALTLIWGGFAIFMITLFRRFQCNLSAKAHRACAAVLILGFMCFFVFFGSYVQAAGQWYPVAIWYLSFRAAPILGIPCLCIAFSAQWGVDLAHSRDAHAKESMDVKAGRETDRYSSEGLSVDTTV